MSCNRALNIKSVPMNAKWEIEEAFCLSTKDLTVAGLAGDYFVVSNSAGTRYKVWFDDGVAVEPTVVDTTALAVDVSAATTPALIATAISSAINAVGAVEFTGTVSDGTTVQFVYDDVSKVNSVEQGTAGFALQLVRIQIGGSIDMGLLDSDISVDPSTEVTEIQAHQFGLTILGQNVTSVGATISLTLKEYSPAKYREIFEAIGGRVANTSVTGFGTALVSTNLLLKAKRLVLHPVYKAANDLTEDYTFWKAVPDLGAITFSGENPNTLPLEFTAFQDDSKPADVNVFAFGDITTLP